MIYPLRGEKIIFPFRTKSQQRILRKKIPKQVQLLLSLSENKREENKNFIQPAILGISRWLPFEENFFQKGVNFWRFSLPTKWRDKYFSWIGLVSDFLDAYQWERNFQDHS